MGRTTIDPTLRTLADRLAADLTRRALRARCPRAFLSLDELQPLAEAVFERIADQLDDHETGRWLRWLEALGDAVLEVPLGPGAGSPVVVRVDSPTEHVLRDLDQLAEREALLRGASEHIERLGDTADDKAERGLSRKRLGSKLTASTLKAPPRQHTNGLSGYG